MTTSPPHPGSEPSHIGDPTHPGTSTVMHAAAETATPIPAAASSVHYGPVTGPHGTAWRGRPLSPGPSPQPLAEQHPASAWVAARSEVTPGVTGVVANDAGYASWTARVIAWLIDQGPAVVAAVVVMTGYGLWIAQLVDPQAMTAVPRGLAAIVLIIGAAAAVLALAWTAANRWVIAGRTGQSLGKRRRGLVLLSEDTRAPIGPLPAFVRDLVHLLDGITVVGALWPRWDDRRQTLADKLSRTVVVRASARPIDQVG